MRSLKEKAITAKDKKSQYGQDIAVDAFSDEAPIHSSIEDLSSIPTHEQQELILTGIDFTEQQRSGTFMLKDASSIHAHSKIEGLEIMPIRKALKEVEWIRDYYWHLASVDTDKYTARAFLDLQDGYVIRALPGCKVTMPAQACLFIKEEGFNQNVHNIVIAEEGSELHLISGCSTASHVSRGLHVGVTEYYVKKNAMLSFTMTHDWGEEVAVRPRSVGIVEEGGTFLNNYICTKPVKSLQMYPTTYLTGKGAVARFYSLLVGSADSELDVGGRIYLHEENTKAEIISRAITNGGTIISRGEMIGEKPGVKGHLECHGLILKGGLMHAIPELKGTAEGVELSHEAAVGKIAQEEILYLMSRGLTEEEATSMIVRGFLSVDIPGLPAPLKTEIDRAVEASQKDVL